MFLDHDSRAVIASVAVIALAVVGAGQASTLASSLPDGRVYEMVTPVENHDADIDVPRVLPPYFVNNSGEVETRLPFQVATDGESVAYLGAPQLEVQVIPPTTRATSTSRNDHRRVIGNHL